MKKFNISYGGTKVSEFALPGFEHCDAERAAVVAVETGERLTGEIAQPKANIDSKAGEIEQHSPLFRGHGPQGELF